MAVLEIVKYPDPCLRKKCSEVKEITDEVRTLVDDMVETMYHAPGLGLAAPQVGSSLRIIVIDVGGDEDTGREAKLYKIINPIIVKKDGWTDSEEGCLSIPSIRDSIKRFSQVVVGGLDEHGKTIEIDADGLLAFCLQHEIDHIDGVLFIDHLSRLKQELVKAKLAKLARCPEE